MDFNVVKFRPNIIIEDYVLTHKIFAWNTSKQISAKSPSN